MKVWEVTVSWASGEGAFVDTYLYDTKEKAQKSFNLEIIDAMEDYGFFNEQGELTNDEWELDKGETFWEIWETGYYTSNHCTITLCEKIIL